MFCRRLERLSPLLSMTKVHVKLLHRKTEVRAEQGAVIALGLTHNEVVKVIQVLIPVSGTAFSQGGLDKGVAAPASVPCCACDGTATSLMSWYNCCKTQRQA